MASPLSKRQVPLWGVILTVGLSVAAVLGYVAIEYGFSALPGFLLFCLVLAIAAPLIALFSAS